MSEVLIFLIVVVLFVIAYYWSQGDTKKRLAKIKKQNPNIKRKTKPEDRYKKTLAKPKYR